ncbi:MAG: NUDIX domain-containing protein [Oscillospiraceae bacterium]|nr:NUDIX domain-containing protein [Oscillospiraceae bacterium]
MKREKSCGAVIYYEAGGRRVYLIERMRQGHLSLCKGHVERNETERETALREIREETALTVEFRDGFRETTEYSPRPGRWKTVVFFLARADSLDVLPQPEEVAELLWLPFGEAADALTFESDREVLRRAEALLAERERKG